MKALKTLVLTGMLALSSCMYNQAVDVKKEKTPLSRKALRSYVAGNTYNIYSNRGHGTGFLLNTPNGKFIITNAHVCEGVKSGNYVFIKKNKEIVPQILTIHKISENHDLCAIRAGIYKTDKGLHLGKVAEEGDYVAVVGFPLDNRITMVEGEYVSRSITRLMDKAKSKDKCAGDWVKADVFTAAITGVSHYCMRNYTSMTITAPIYPGNSGSALVNAYGNVIGVIFAGRSGSTVSGRAVPLDDLKKFLGEL